MSEATLRIRSKIFPPTKNMTKAGIKAKASVRLYIGDSKNCVVELNNFLIRKRRKDGRLFIAPPQEQYENSSGETKYFHLVRFAPDEDYDEEGGLREQFEKTIMSAYKKAIKKTRDDDDNDDYDEEPRRKKSKKRRDDWYDDDDDEPRRKKSKRRDEDFDDDEDDDEDDWI